MNKRWLRVNQYNNQKYKQIYDMVNSTDIEMQNLGRALEKKLNIYARNYVNDYTMESLDMLKYKLKYFGVKVSITEKSTNIYQTLFGQSIDGKDIDQSLIQASLPDRRVLHEGRWGSYKAEFYEYLSKGLYVNRKGVWYKHIYK